MGGNGIRGRDIEEREETDREIAGEISEMVEMGVGWSARIYDKGKIAEREIESQS